ncbi:MAG: Bro-N domain-containing protein [Bacteroidia bacterium]
MKKDTSIKLFEENKVRTQWDEEKEKWYFSVIDIVAVLTEQKDYKKAQSYWTTLKHRLKNEGSEVVTKCDKLKLIASDGKKYLTDVADIETIFRLVQSIPSPKAEPFKLWIAKVARERIDEIEDPEIGIDRLMEAYLKKGYSKEWINQRLKSIEVRKELTDEWEERGVKKGEEYAILTDEITKAWSGFSVKNYKKHKDLKKENLRDNMTNLELVLNMLAEATTAEISKEKKPKTFVENKKIANQGGTIAGNTRKEIEAKTGKKVVSDLSAKKLLATKIKKINK